MEVFGVTNLKNCFFLTPVLKIKYFSNPVAEEASSEEETDKEIEYLVPDGET